jgi:glutamate/tyrosine decarboxylase-like PLP-dependent enzyme
LARNPDVGARVERIHASKWTRSRRAATGTTVPASADGETLDRINEGIVETVNESGRAYMTHTNLDGRVAMRIGVGNVLTEERHLDDLWAQITRSAGLPGTDTI